MGKTRLGVTDGKLARMPSSPNAVSSQTNNRRMYVDPLPLTGSVTESKERILSCLQKMGGNSVTSQTDNYIHAVFTTPLMRFKDDVEFFIDEDAHAVHFRSASRLGYSDLGANRKRYQAFRKLFG